MMQALLFIWHILIFDVIQPLPCSSQYLDKHFCLSGEHTAGCAFPSRYRQIVRVGKARLGWPGIILANLALMFFCLPISLSADWIIHTTHVLWIKRIVNAILSLMLLQKFDMLRFYDSRNYLKLIYLLGCLLSSSYWTLTSVLLAAFENIAF